MILDQDMMAKIKPDEVWLQNAMPADPPVSLERIKLRARIEVNHIWLRQNTGADPREADLKGVKRAVRAQTAGVGAATTPRPRRRWLMGRQITGLAAAAVVMFAVGLALYGPGGATLGGGTLTLGLDDWVDAVAFDALALGEEAGDLAVLEDGLASLEESLAENASAGWGRQELDDLGDELEVLLTETG